MDTKKIKIIYWDGDNPDVYYNHKKLSEKEIVDLLVEYMKEKDKIIDKIDNYLFEAELDISNRSGYNIWTPYGIIPKPLYIGYDK